MRFAILGLLLALAACNAQGDVTNGSQGVYLGGNAGAFYGNVRR